MKTTCNKAPLTAWLAALMLTAAGCGGDSSSASVHGVVTLDGQPLEYGSIRFEISETESFSAPIEEGKYTAPKATAGEATVTFTSDPKPPQVSSREELEKTAGQKVNFRPIPPDNPNQRQQVTVESGSNELNFDL
ncbi:hypothetical protein Pla123a_22500 [Posidoniimonas polymericola]|uniref:Carboxypeptidase regulatory-like domain-containing protein n=1 Tax=Posidoniimonas polymericola TaxID=2528002 RepID=A0A5C5YPX7_9BACT|nr:hypothetical protein [Posidoniimonas polymericola]TWT76827.1 hypothetical protein Pla123a_22500 [Posidoniimonas polymericola]